MVGVLNFEGRMGVDAYLTSTDCLVCQISSASKQLTTERSMRGADTRCVSDTDTRCVSGRH
jgi:hypothetical protein